MFRGFTQILIIFSSSIHDLIRKNILYKASRISNQTLAKILGQGRQTLLYNFVKSELDI